MAAKKSFYCESLPGGLCADMGIVNPIFKEIEPDEELTNSEAAPSLNKFFTGVIICEAFPLLQYWSPILH